MRSVEGVILLLAGSFIGFGSPLLEHGLTFVERVPTSRPLEPSSG